MGLRVPKPPFWKRKVVSGDVVERNGVKGILRVRRRFIFDGHFYPFGWRFKEFVPFQPIENKPTAAVNPNTSRANGREYLLYPNGERIDITTFDSYNPKEEPES